MKNKLSKLLVLSVAPLMLTGCWSMKVDKPSAEVLTVDLKCKGTYEILDSYYDEESQDYYNDVLMLDFYFVNTNELITINYFEIDNLEVFYQVVYGLDNDSNPVIEDKKITYNSYGCSQRIEVLPNARYDFKLGFPTDKYDTSFFQTVTTLEEEKLSVTVDLTVNPVPAKNGLLFTYKSSSINADDGKTLYVDVEMYNETGTNLSSVVFQDIKIYDSKNGNPIVAANGALKENSSTACRSKETITLSFEFEEGKWTKSFWQSTVTKDVLVNAWYTF